MTQRDSRPEYCDTLHRHYSNHGGNSVGGAITYLFDAEQEYDEMILKGAGPFQRNEKTYRATDS